MGTLPTIQTGIPSVAPWQPPPLKRRKLAFSTAAVIETPQSQSVTVLTKSEDSRTHVSRLIATAGGQLVCACCHRAISTRLECIILCARCCSPTCPICSRICTAPPLSQPTLYLTYAPTSAPTPSFPTSLSLPTPLAPSVSPRRTALGLTSLNINNPSLNVPSVVSGVGPRRRKFRDEEGNLDPTAEAEMKFDELGMKGCGRVMCKGCCDENWQCGSTTCWDCYECV